MRDLSGGIRVLERADYRRMRWKNGQGWTTEIVVHPQDVGLSGRPFDWRISMAEIEHDGDFSAYAGYDRTILIAEGNGMELSFNAARTQTLRQPYQPLRFKGEWHTHCRLLNGPVRDFNVMTARARAQHRCNIVREVCEFAPEPGTQTLIVHCLHGSAETRNSPALYANLQVDETLVCADAEVTQRLSTSATGVDTVLAIVSLKPAVPV